MFYEDMHRLRITPYVFSCRKHKHVRALTKNNTETKNVSSSGCGVPVRDKGHDFIAIGISGIVVAVLAFLLRLGASIPKNGRKMSWDDSTMGLVVALAVPPAIFAIFCKFPIRSSSQ